MSRSIARQTGLIPACDIDLEAYEQLVKETADLPMVTAYKVGFVLGLSAGLPKVVEVTRKYTDKPLIYDHQKAATDIPATGVPFAKTLKQAGIDIAILFPQAGPITQQAWIEALREQELGVIVGGWMSHKGYTKADGGYLEEEGILSIYKLAASLGVTDYVGPGNQPEVVTRLRKLLEGEGVVPTFYMPGLLTQGGDIKEAGEAAGGRWQAIVGRAITRAEDYRQAAIDAWPFDEGDG